MTWTKKNLAIAAVGGGAAAALAYATLVEPYQLRTVEVTLNCPRLPRSFDGYRVLQMSDLHMRRFGRREKILVDLLKSLPEHDLAVITGDLIHTPNGAAPFMEVVRHIRARDGVFAIFGNSEHKNGVRSGRFAEELSRRGVHALINEHAVVSRDTQQLFILGVDDPVSQMDDLPAAVRGIPEDDFKLLLMHSPDPIALAASYGIDVVLSGHTHGGQVRLPMIGPLFTNSLLGITMDEGHFSGKALYRLMGFRAGRTQLYVSRGIGVSSLALRFGCPPELNSITLRRL